jgi:alpha-mannosidase
VLADDVPIRFLDGSDVGDLYTYCPDDPARAPVGPGSLAIHGHEVIAAWDRLLVLMRFTRRADEPFLRLEGVVRNERDDHRLRLHVGLPAPAEGSLAGSPFELVRRPLVGEGSHHETASPTWPARHLVEAAGVGLLHEGVFEYEVAGDDLAVTLVRAVGAISRERLATRPFAAGPQTPTPDAQLHGETPFALGVWPGAPADDPAALLAGWERFGLTLAEAPAAGGGSLPREGSLLAVDAGRAQLSNVRRLGDEIRVRLWNPHADRAVEASVAGRRVDLPPARICTVAGSTTPPA